MGDVKEYLSNTTVFWVIPTVPVWMQSFVKRQFSMILAKYGIRKGRGYGVTDQGKATSNNSFLHMKK